MNAHPAVSLVREFEREADQIDRQLAKVERDLRSGLIDDSAFDAECRRILGDDYAAYPLLEVPRPLAAVHVGVAPGRDLRWRGVPATTRRIDGLDRHYATSSDHERTGREVRRSA